MPDRVESAEMTFREATLNLSGRENFCCRRLKTHGKEQEYFCCGFATLCRATLDPKGGKDASSSLPPPFFPYF